MARPDSVTIPFVGSISTTQNVTKNKKTNMKSDTYECVRNHLLVSTTYIRNCLGSLGKTRGLLLLYTIVQPWTFEKDWSNLKKLLGGHISDSILGGGSTIVTRYWGGTLVTRYRRDTLVTRYLGGNISDSILEGGSHKTLFRLLTL